MISQPALAQRASALLSAKSRPLCFGFGQPAAAEFFRRDAGHIRLEVENGRAVEHIKAANVQAVAAAAEDFDDCQPDRVRATRGSCGEHPVRTPVDRRGTEKLEVLGAVKLPNYKKVREG